MKIGYQWNMLPSDFPPKSAVYTCFKQWKAKPQEDEMCLREWALKKSG
jgi:hypothetical protein